VLQSLAFAAFGALAVQLLNLMELKNVTPDRRPNLKDWLYWFPFVGSPFIGGGLALAHELSAPLTALVAINVGAAAPVLFRSMATGGDSLRGSVDTPPGA